MLEGGTEVTVCYSIFIVNFLDLSGHETPKQLGGTSMGRIGRSWQLVKQSFAILQSDKELALLPVLSAISCVLVSGFVILGGTAASWPEIHSATAAGLRFQPNPQILWPAVFAFYLVNYLVIVFFNVALVSAASERLAGRPTTLRDGLNKAWERKGKILEWAVLAATVGMLLKLIEQRSGLIGNIIAKVIGVAWTLASYFVAPILAFEGLGPIDALKRSADIFRQTWGEEIVGRISISVIFGLLALAGAPVCIAAMYLGGMPGLGIGVGVWVLYLIALSVVSSALQGIFTAALYQYATTKTAPAGFSVDTLSSAWGPKKKKSLL
jgi:hypothetical protein